MLTLLLIVLAVVGLLVVMRREAGPTPALAVLAVLGVIGLVVDATTIGVLLLLGAAAIAIAGLPALRRQWLTPRLFAMFKKVAPKVSDTERTA
ncbi:MAG: acyl-CoA dehydrogenase, partial [Pseudomonadota bacterium]